MANDWIKMRMNLADDPAVIGIAARLKLDRPSVVGRLHALWSWAGEHSTDGFLPYVTAEIVDEKAGKKGFADAMTQPGIGWLSIETGGVRFPHFDRHNGESAKKRAMDMDRKREKRAMEADAERTVGGGLSAFPADKKRTREEKRRTEKSGGGPLDSTTSSPPEAAAEPPPRDKIVDESDFPELERLFPLVDIRAELAGALRYRREKKGDVTGVELRFFAEDWLPRATPRTPAQQAVAEKKAATTGEPEGWQAWMDEHFPDWVYATGKEPGARAWANHSAMNQKFVRDSMARGGGK
jgi:hypothetical protein